MERLLYDNREKISADLQVLIDIGLLLVCDENLELYHGRARKNTEQREWEVDPSFDNSGNNTGNRNVYGVKCISTGTKEIAEEFARKRCGYYDVPEIHRIQSIAPNSLVYNVKFDLNALSSEDMRRVNVALFNINKLFVSEGAPVPFEYRNKARAISIALNEELDINNCLYISDEMVEKVTHALGVKNEIVAYLAGAINAKNLIRNSPHAVMQRYALEKKTSDRDVFEIKLPDGSRKLCPMNNRYVAAWLKKNNIIGIKTHVDSVTVGKTIAAYFLFDITKVNTQKALEKKVDKAYRRYGQMSNISKGMFKDPKIFDLLLNAGPRELVKFAKNNSSAGRHFGRSANVWEGFTIGQHTETALRVFEDSFNLEVPKDIVPLAKLIILAHDIEKGLSTTECQNNMAVRMLLEDFGLNAKAQNLILGVIYNSQKYTSKYFVNKDEVAKAQLYECCENMLKDLKGETTKEEVAGLMGLCVILQSCDSGAYTRHSVTRGDECYYYNGNDRFGEIFNILGMQNNKLELSGYENIFNYNENIKLNDFAQQE